MEFTYPVSKALFRALLRTFSDWRVVGRENVPETGPLIVVANHLSYVDPPLLATSIPRRLHFLSTKKIFRGRLISALLRNYGAFQLRGAGRDYRALSWAVGVAKGGGAVGIFPEGQRNPQGLERAISPGVAAIALRSRALILPVGITGTERLGSVWRAALPTGKLTVHIGQPFLLPPASSVTGRDRLWACTDLIMERVASLLPEAYRGVYRSGYEQAAVLLGRKAVGG